MQHVIDWREGYLQTPVQETPPPLFCQPDIKRATLSFYTSLGCVQGPGVETTKKLDVESRDHESVINVKSSPDAHNANRPGKYKQRQQQRKALVVK